jgi:hypothetical protein
MGNLVGLFTQMTAINIGPLLPHIDGHEDDKQENRHQITNFGQVLKRV